MAKFVPDSQSRRWVIIAPGRIARPHDNLPAPPGRTDPSCPFEPGNETLNEEVFRIGGQPGDPHWQIRVIKNKYPITDFHEVIIHGPDHEKDIDTFPLDQVELIFQTYRCRYNYHVQAGHGHVLIFNNHDVHAGASISHPHSQLVVVPKEINLETIAREPVDNIVAETKYLTVYCPNFSQWPYEVWLAPRSLSEVGIALNSENPEYSGNRNISKSDNQKARISDTPTLRNSDTPSSPSFPKTFGQVTNEEISDLAVILQKLLRFIVQKFSEPGGLKQKGNGAEVPYNYYIYHGPDWYLRIIPRLIHRAGLELGTGLSVNIIDPAQAAEQYRSF